MSAALKPGSRLGRALRCTSAAPAPVPASIGRKLDLVARRIKCGSTLFEACDSVPGSATAITRRLGVYWGTWSYWKKVWLPEKRRYDVAKALGISPIFISGSDTERLQRAGQLVTSGVAFAAALLQTKACSALARQIGCAKSQVRRWNRYGVPGQRIGRVAAILGCSPDALPRSLGRSEYLRTTKMPEHVWQAMLEGLRSPKTRAILSAKAKRQPRISGRFAKPMSWRV